MRCFREKLITSSNIYLVAYYCNNWELMITTTEKRYRILALFFFIFLSNKRGSILIRAKIAGSRELNESCIENVTRNSSTVTVTSRSTPNILSFFRRRKACFKLPWGTLQRSMKRGSKDYFSSPTHPEATEAN